MKKILIFLFAVLLTVVFGMIVTVFVISDIDENGNLTRTIDIVLPAPEQTDTMMQIQIINKQTK